MVTLKDVAEHAGVSIPVVSAYLNDSNHAQLSEAIQRRVAAAVDEIGYVPSRSRPSRSQRPSKTPVVAVLAPELDDPVLAEMLRGVYDAISRVDWVVLLGDSARMAKDSQQCRHLLAGNSVNGILLLRSPVLDENVLSEVLTPKSPVLLLERAIGSGYPWLALDDADGIRAATEHLLELDHEQIDFFGGRDAAPTMDATKLRYQGYVDGLATRGLAPRPPIACDHGPEHGYEAFTAMLAARIAQRRRDAPTALVVNDVSTAAGVLAAADDAGISVPGDLSIIGYHDTATARLSRPPLSTVKMPVHELGVRGARTLGQLMNGRVVPSGAIDDLKPEVIRRGSTGPPSPTSP